MSVDWFCFVRFHFITACLCLIRTILLMFWCLIEEYISVSIYSTSDYLSFTMLYHVLVILFLGICSLKLKLPSLISRVSIQVSNCVELAGPVAFCRLFFVPFMVLNCFLPALLLTLLFQKD